MLLQLDKAMSHHLCALALLLQLQAEVSESLALLLYLVYGTRYGNNARRFSKAQCLIIVFAPLLAAKWQC